MPAESTRREISGQRLARRPWRRSAPRAPPRARHDVEPGDVVDGEQAAAARRRGPRRAGRCRGRAASSATTSGSAPAAPPASSGESGTGRSPRPCRPWTTPRIRRAAARRRRSATPKPRLGPSASQRRRPRRARPGRRPASSAPARAARCPSNGVCSAAAEQPGGSSCHDAAGSKTQRSAGAPSARPPGAVRGRAAGARPSTAHRSAGHRRERLRQAEAGGLAPLQRQAEQQLEPGRAGLGLGERQVLLVLGRPACGR